MVRMQKILIPVDFSENSEQAVRYGAEIARDRKAKLYFLHVVDKRIVESIRDLSEKGYKGDFQAATRNMMHDREEDLLKFIPEDIREGIDVAFEIRQGNPAGEIIGFAREKGIDLIVVGTSGRSALEIALVGSVARNVVDHAGCPVLVVRPIEHDLIS